MWVLVATSIDSPASRCCTWRQFHECPSVVVRAASTYIGAYCSHLVVAVASMAGALGVPVDVLRHYCDAITGFHPPPCPRPLLALPPARRCWAASWMRGAWRAPPGFGTVRSRANIYNIYIILLLLLMLGAWQ